MLIEELRKISKKYNDKAEIKRQKSIKKYEVKIIKELRRVTASTGKIRLEISLPRNIMEDIEEIFKSEGFRVVYLGGDFSYVTLLIKEERGK